MYILKKWFGGRKKSFLECNNVGTRFESNDEAIAFWKARFGTKYVPNLIYTFCNEDKAREALLGIKVIHVAKDSGKLISTEVINFGYYKLDDGGFEAFLSGQDLGKEIFEQSRRSFVKCGGTKKNENPPEISVAAPQKPKNPHSSNVEFLRKDRQLMMGVEMTYLVHNGPDAKTAKGFLGNSPVDKPHIYIVVETPDGNYCRDVNGIYKEQ